MTMYFIGVSGVRWISSNIWGASSWSLITWGRHKFWQRWWLTATLPRLPLPWGNIPIYFSIWTQKTVSMSSSIILAGFLGGWVWRFLMNLCSIHEWVDVSRKWRICFCHVSLPTGIFLYPFKISCIYIYISLCSMLSSLPPWEKLPLFLIYLEI